MLGWGWRRRNVISSQQQLRQHWQQRRHTAALEEERPDKSTVRVRHTTPSKTTHSVALTKNVGDWQL